MMGNLIIRISDVVDAIFIRVALFALVMLVLVVLLQVVARYVFFQPPVWTEEISRYLMIWAGLLGATAAFKRAYDPAIFQPEMKGVLKAVYGFIQSLAVAIFVAPVLFYSFVGPSLRFDRGFLARHMTTFSETLDVSTIYVAVSVPLALSIILLHLLARWLAKNPDTQEGEVDVNS